ncbi:putative prefoldin subunit domain containing protein [Erysiphe necator]|uniref:Putative prefoldin subunit domain containing protein n=1 Tax=Uncinula necator TaxID=52586 RepID=A0A0B1P6X4_UNCNE|nr:putative prefoldin subunit domain containing protein [Erysiphe necator]
MSLSNDTQTSIELENLSLQQLSQVKKQLDDELDHLTNSFSQLRGAQTKFQECARSIENGVSPAIMEKPILVALTSSLYVPGVLADPSHVIVDIGTGFYVEKTTDDAKKFYEARVKDLGSNLKTLESILQGKVNNSRVVEEVLRQKILKVGSTEVSPKATG